MDQRGSMDQQKGREQDMMTMALPRVLAMTPTRVSAMVLTLVQMCSLGALVGARPLDAVPLLLGEERWALLPQRGGRAGTQTWRATAARQLGQGLSLEQGIVMMGTRRVVGRPHAALHGAAVFHGANESLLPEAYDVRDRWWRCSAVSRVMNQGPCGSCYAVASADTLSASICIHSGGADDLVFSAQDMLSCSDDMRCLGGTIPVALTYLCEHGAVQESCVTYRAGDSWDHGHLTDACRKTCEMDQALIVRHSMDSPDRKKGEKKGGGGGGAGRRHVGADCSNSFRLLANEQAVKEAILTVGPVTAYIDAYRSLVHYRDGIYTCPQPSACTTMGPDAAGLDCPLLECSECNDVNGRADCDDCYLGGHAVTIIGWGRGDAPGPNASTPSTSRGDAYWIVKNSWGKHWGEEGVFRISADYASNCNLLVDCTDPARRTDCVWGINVNNPMGWVPPSAPAPAAPVGDDDSVDATAIPRKAALAMHASRASRASAPVSPPVTPSAENAERVLASVACGLAALSSVLLALVAWLLASYPELRAFPMNRLLPLTLTLLATALCLLAHRILFLGGVIALDQVCAVEGYTYLISTLCSAGIVVAVSLQLLVVRVLSPMDASEGCADFHLRTASVLLTIAVGLLPAVGMALIISVANDSDFWPSPFRTLPHSFEWQRKLFDYPLGLMLLLAASLLFALHVGVIFRCCRDDVNDNTFRRGERGLESALRRPRDRLWTVDRVASVLAVYLITWVPGVAVAVATILDLPAAYMELMLAAECMDAARGSVVALAACLLLQLPEYVRWSRVSAYSPVRRHAIPRRGGPLSALVSLIVRFRSRQMQSVEDARGAAGGSGGGGGSRADEHVEAGGRGAQAAGSEAEEVREEDAEERRGTREQQASADEADGEHGQEQVLPQVAPPSSASAPARTSGSSNYGGDETGAAQSDAENGHAQTSVEQEDVLRVPLLPESVAGGGDGGGGDDVGRGGGGRRAPFIYTFYESWAYSAGFYLRFPPPDA